MTPEQKTRLLNWVATHEISPDNTNKVLTCTSLDVETLCPRVYASNHGTYALYEVAPGLLFSIANRCTSANWIIPQDFDTWLQVYVGYEQENYNKVREYFSCKGCEFSSRKSKRPQLLKKPLELKLTKFKVYDVLYYFESTNLDPVFVIF
ncbi:MAG: hypothetical protein AAGJ08_13855 [Cyanobacteria bacterium P01_H01_bin.35]